MNDSYFQPWEALINQLRARDPAFANRWMRASQKDKPYVFVNLSKGGKTVWSVIDFISIPNDLSQILHDIAKDFFVGAEQNDSLTTLYIDKLNLPIEEIKNRIDQIISKFEILQIFN